MSLFVSNAMKSTVEIIVVVHNAIFLEGLKTLLEMEPECRILAICHSAEELPELLDANDPDLILLDTDVPEMKSMEMAYKLTQWGGELKLCALTLHDSRNYMLQLQVAGFKGMVHKNHVKTMLWPVIQKIVKGETVFNL